MANKVTETIKTRVSCRSYSERKVSKKNLQEILECGKMAPSAKNRQISNILAITSKRNVEKLRKLANDEMGRDVFYGANTIVLVHGPREDKFCDLDGACILENLFVAANALKIQSCWINQVDDLFKTKAGMKIKKNFLIPEENRIVGSCILGYAQEDTKLETKSRKDDFIRII